MLKKTDLKKLKKKYNCNENNIIRNRILNKTALVDLITDFNDNLDVMFNIEVRTHGVLDQKTTGRCWSYAGLNLLRESVIKKCNLDNFELSGSYIAFYDKLERFNTYMIRLEKYHSEGRNIYDKEIHFILKNGFDDGSNFSEFKELVKKYGVIPKNVFSNSFHSNDTAELNEILSRLLRKFYLELIESKIDIKDKYLQKVYNLLGNIYGIPSDTFDFEYIDKDNIYHIDYGLTPKQFYDRYISIDLDNYIEIYSYKDEKYSYDEMYVIDDSSMIYGQKSLPIMNIEYKELEKLMVKQLKNNDPVYISTSTTPKYINGIWLDLMNRYSDFFNMDLNISNNDNVRLYGTTGEHSMLLTGVSIKNDKINKWKMENSWGSSEGMNGYFIAENLFIKNYLISAVINKKYLDKKKREIIKKRPILISKWDYKFW